MQLPRREFGEALDGTSAEREFCIWREAARYILLLPYYHTSTYVFTSYASVYLIMIIHIEYVELCSKHYPLKTL